MSRRGNSNSNSSRGGPPGGPMTQEEEDSLPEDVWERLYAGLPQIPSDEGWGRNWRSWHRSCTKFTSMLSDSIWVAFNLDKSET